MKDWLTDLFNSVEGLVLFVCLALGFALGKIKFWKISLGGVAGTLIVAIFVGMMGVTLNSQVKNIAFALFIFTLGYMSGPSFFASLNKHSLKYGIFTIVEVVTILVVVGLATAILNLDQGTAAGLLAGGATESAVVGTATDAIAKLDLPADQIKTLQGNVGTAYSISYIMGLITIVLFTSQFAPAIMRVNLREEAAKLWEKLGGGSDAEGGATSALPDLVGRAHEVTFATGKTVGQVEAALGESIAIERVRRAGANLDVTSGTRLAAGDVVLLHGRREQLIDGYSVIGPERAGIEGMNVDLDVQEVVLTAPGYGGKTLGDIRASIPQEERHGVFLSGISRMDHNLPVQNGTQINQGDTLRFTGAKRDLASFVPRVGFVIDPSVKMDVIFIAIGVILGMLIGKIEIPLGSIPLSLGTGGGCLLSGLLFGWLRARNPKHGQYHPAAAQVVKDLGLATFICAVGLSSGPQAVDLIKQYGFSLPIAGILVTLIPASISLFVGWKLMKLPAPLTLGAVAGQQCSTPAATAVQQAAGNTTPLMSYTIVYALSNVVLPLLGPIVVALTGAIS
ncbi:aspartate-alanine antiporter [Allocatelliglobosispora scoriae]|uniref:Aspartate-alanine antiporter n=1 Tax=Allocatelliglobosispora scoriae TaxID=643052 RepID=A0A841C299_9ACTN|nr:aspartate-alanine antiporter [Allocatelliglobosispora scoriae]MBB5873263.1 aspartate-alanine antiporter [Allocatelliglobosispora scoriae]